MKNLGSVIRTSTLILQILNELLFLRVLYHVIFSRAIRSDNEQLLHIKVFKDAVLIP